VLVVLVQQVKELLAEVHQTTVQINGLVVVVVVLALAVQTHLTVGPMVAMVVQEQPHLSLVHLLPVVAVAVERQGQLQVSVALAVVVQVMTTLVQQTLVVVRAVLSTLLAVQPVVQA
jgi:hypothetical protein